MTSRPANLLILGFRDLDRFLSLALSPLRWRHVALPRLLEPRFRGRAIIVPEKKMKARKSFSAVFDDVFGYFGERTWLWADLDRIILRIRVSTSENHISD